MRRVIPVILSLCLLLALAVPVGAAEPMSEEFKAFLNEDGKLDLYSILPKNDDYAMMLGDLQYEKGYYLGDWSSDFRKCTLYAYELGEEHEVEVEYIYDATVAAVADKLTAAFPENMASFQVSDMELVNYWIHTADLEIDPDTDATQSLDNYSGQVKALLQNMNFRLIVDNRAGDDSPFWIERLGFASLTHNDTIYYIHPMLGVRADHVIYLPEDTADDADSLLAAAQKRMDEYAPDKVEVAFGGQDIEQFFLDRYDADIAECRRNLDAAIASGDPLEIMNAEMYLEWAQDYKDYFVQDWADPNGEYAFLHKAEGDCWFTATVGDSRWTFITVKDDDKMLSPTYASADAKTDVTVSTADVSVPLDTEIAVEKLTEGAEYERITAALAGKDGQTFDISLHSPTLNEDVTKLEKGTFEVKMPIPESLKGKAVSAYYVDSEGRVTEHTAGVKDGYAVFTTDHFSAYTLATASTNNPPTGDGSWLWALSAVVAMGVAVVLVMKRKKA